ncbi:MAG TPA: HAD family hydrolase [Bacteroidales bacterium]|nr:HAD family hydrolase [Bacteroidales bacterium]HOE04097.1 HAD family hydrolase [Bacteroidales bacterium]HQL71284.1 HAD family hydrolase [Bacteroidales bacterium]
MKNKAIFLDRDGVINFERGDYNLCVDDFVVNEGVGEAIALLKQHGFRVLVISNQAAISRGLLSFDVVEAMHDKLKKHLELFGTAVDEIYYCPHHESVTRCLCRKPSPLFIEKAVSRFGLDVRQSYFIGDRERDIEAAAAAGVKGILIESNYRLPDLCKQIVLGKL